MIRSNEAGSWGGCGAGDVSGVSVWETGLERLRDDGLDGRDDPGSELELSIPSGEPPGVNMAGMSSLAGLGLYPMNCPEALRRCGIHCHWGHWAVL